MISRKFSFFNKFYIEIESEKPTGIIDYFDNEYKYNVIQKMKELPRISTVTIIEKIEIPKKATVLINNTFYFFEEKIYFSTADNVLMIEMQEDMYKITAEIGFDDFAVFYIQEILMRYYATKFNIVFLHASAFEYNKKCYVVNAFGGTGKTNLLLDVLEDKGRYVADDLTAVDQDGNVYPYQKRINLLYYNLDYKKKLLSTLHQPSWILKVIDLIDNSDKSSFLYRFLLFRIEWKLRRRLNMKVDYRKIYNSNEISSSYKADHFIWLERTENKTNTFTIDNKYIYDRMTFCLDLENRSFLDFDGYLSLIFPLLSQFKNRQNEIIQHIVETNHFTGLKKVTGDEKGLFDLIKEI